MHRAFRPELIFILIVAAVASGCGASPETVPDQFDEETAVTLTSSRPPLILVRDNSATAAYAKDFVYVGPVGVNRMGYYRYYLWFGIWSAIPGELQGAQRDGFDSVTIFADGEPLQLELAGWTPSAIGASRNAYVKPVASAADAYYEVTIDQIRLIAQSRDVRIVTTGMHGGSYELWDDQGAAFVSLRRFVESAVF